MTRDYWSDEFKLTHHIHDIMCKDISKWADEVKALNGEVKTEREYYLATDLEWAIEFAQKIMQLSQLDFKTLMPDVGQLYKAGAEIDRIQREADAEDWHHR